MINQFNISNRNDKNIAKKFSILKELNAFKIELIKTSNNK